MVAGQGAGQSAEPLLCSPLGCILKHWNKFGGVPLTRKKLKEYCTQWWLVYKLDDEERWLEMGTLNYNTILQLMLFCRRQDKWDEIPYVDMFFALRNYYETRKKCKLSVSDSNVLMKMEEKRQLCTRVNDKEKDVQLLVPSDSNQGNVSGGQGGEIFSPIAGRTRAQQKVVLQDPLRKAVGPDGMPVHVKVPFYTSDLINWKESAGSYRENPEKEYQPFQIIIENHNPDWKDIQVLLNTLLLPEEKKMVWEKAQEENIKLNKRDGPERFMLAQEPDWDPNTGAGWLMIKQYQQLILYGVKRGGPRPKKLAKLYQVVHDKSKDSSAVYERLCVTAWKWTDLDPEDEANKVTFTTLFVGQLAPDIRRKLPKREVKPFLQPMMCEIGNKTLNLHYL
uniref:Core shell protein Gag P30 domain-containing protein n=1 Tax=Aquila chrysaetos chrysaetos TaxID=223781 RepID=A0A663FGX9_AQUCH